MGLNPETVDDFFSRGPRADLATLVEPHSVSSNTPLQVLEDIQPSLTSSSAAPYLQKHLQTWQDAQAKQNSILLNPALDDGKAKDGKWVATTEKRRIYAPIIDLTADDKAVGDNLHITHHTSRTTSSPGSRKSIDAGGRDRRDAATSKMWKPDSHAKSSATAAIKRVDGSLGGCRSPAESGHPRVRGAASKAISLTHSRPSTEKSSLTAGDLRDFNDTAHSVKLAQQVEAARNDDNDFRNPRSVRKRSSTRSDIFERSESKMIDRERQYLLESAKRMGNQLQSLKEEDCQAIFEVVQQSRNQPQPHKVYDTAPSLSSVTSKLSSSRSHNQSVSSLLGDEGGSSANDGAHTQTSLSNNQEKQIDGSAQRESRIVGTWDRVEPTDDTLGACHVSGEDAEARLTKQLQDEKDKKRHSRTISMLDLERCILPHKKPWSESVVKPKNVLSRSQDLARIPASVRSMVHPDQPGVKRVRYKMTTPERKEAKNRSSRECRQRKRERSAKRVTEIKRALAALNPQSVSEVRALNPSHLEGEMVFSDPDSIPLPDAHKSSSSSDEDENEEHAQQRRLLKQNQHVPTASIASDSVQDALLNQCPTVVGERTARKTTKPLEKADDIDVDGRATSVCIKEDQDAMETDDEGTVENMVWDYLVDCRAVYTDGSGDDPMEVSYGPFFTRKEANMVASQHLLYFSRNKDPSIGHSGSWSTDSFGLQTWCYSDTTTNITIGVRREIGLKARLPRDAGRIPKKVFQVYERVITRYHSPNTKDQHRHRQLGIWSVLDAANRSAGQAWLGHELRELPDIPYTFIICKPQMESQMREELDTLEQENSFFRRKHTIDQGDHEMEVEVWVVEQEILGPRN